MSEEIDGLQRMFEYAIEKMEQRIDSLEAKSADLEEHIETLQEEVAELRSYAHSHPILRGKDR